MKIYEKGTLAVWFHQDEDQSTATFEGQDLGGYPGSSEYEYWITVDRNELRQALDVDPADSLENTVLTHADEIVGMGEMTWLKERGVAYDFSSMVH